jgi:hypothetical protein
MAKAKTAATVRLRSRRLAPTLLKKLIVESSRSERRVARQATTSHIARHRAAVSTAYVHR